MVNKITGLLPQKKNPDRDNLFLNEEFYCGVDQEVILKFGLKVGLSIDDDTAEKVLFASEMGKIYHRVLDFLAYRPRSEREVRDYVREKVSKYKLSILEEGDEALRSFTDAIVARAQKLNYLNDVEFVRWWMRQRTESPKPMGLMRIKTELCQKGIEAKIIEQVWDEEFAAESLELLRKHFEKVKNRYDISVPKERKRLVDYLIRKGFMWSDIQNMLK